MSYGRQYTAPTPRLIATVAIGYADGYPRSLSNRAEMLLHGKRAKSVAHRCTDGHPRHRRHGKARVHLSLIHIWSQPMR